MEARLADGSLALRRGIAVFRMIALVAMLTATIAAPAASQSTRTEGMKAFAIEAAGGILGSAAGFGIVMLSVSECEQDDDIVACAIGPAAAALAASTALSSVGTVLAGRANRTSPSVPGAIVGALIGAVAAVGTDHLVREEMNINTSRAGTLVVVAVTQGLLTAATSRLFASLR
jgi:hypothetical protein